MATDQQRAQFAAALREERGALSQAELGRRVGLTGARIGQFEAGENVDPDQVFLLERQLGLPPGRLSRHLGFVPVDADAAADVVAAIEQDPRLALDVSARNALVSLYRHYTGQTK